MLSLKWKGGRVVECSGFENQRGFTVTGGSNPSLSEKIFSSLFGFFVDALFLALL